MNARCETGLPRQDASREAGRHLDELQELLTRQLECVRQGNLTAAEEICRQTEQCVRAIAANRGLDDAHLEMRRRRIESTYKELCLILGAQRAETSDLLSVIRRGRKVLRAYGNHALRT